MKFKNRFKEINKRIKESRNIFIECCDFEELGESIRDWDAEIQDVAHEIEKNNSEHESRKELKIELRRYARKKIIELWKKEATPEEKSEEKDKEEIIEELGFCDVCSEEGKTYIEDEEHGNLCKKCGELAGWKIVNGIVTGYESSPEGLL